MSSIAMRTAVLAAATALSSLGGMFASGIDVTSKLGSALDGGIPHLRMMGMGHSHYRGHMGQTTNRIDRSRMRNQMRRLTQQQQRRAHPGAPHRLYA